MKCRGSTGALYRTIEALDTTEGIWSLLPIKKEVKRIWIQHSLFQTSRRKLAMDLIETTGLSWNSLFGMSFKKNLDEPRT